MASPSEVRIILFLILFRNAPMHLNLDRSLNCYSWCNFKIVFYFIYHILFFLEKTSKRIDVFLERTSPWCFCWFWISWTKSSTVSIVTITFLTSSTMWITYEIIIMKQNYLAILELGLLIQFVQWLKVNKQKNCLLQVGFC